MDRVVVLGAGPLGTAVARQLERRGSEVRLADVLGNPAYTMRGTTPMTIDGRDAGQIAELCDSASAIYLCLNAHYIDWYEAFSALEGKPMRVIGDIDAPHTYIYVDDFAHGLVTLCGELESHGEVWTYRRLRPSRIVSSARSSLERPASRPKFRDPDFRHRQ